MSDLSQVQRDALISAHRLGNRWPMAWNARLRTSLEQRGLVGFNVCGEGGCNCGYGLTSKGIALAHELEWPPQ